MLYLTRIIVILTWIIVRKGDERMPLYNRLKEHRARLGVNQQEMGALAGVSRQTISQIERGGLLPLGDAGAEACQDLRCDRGGHFYLSGG